jgi:ADP-ribosylglycohydrolase
MKLAKKSCLGSHNHIEGIKGAQAIAVAIYLARTKHSKTQIKEEIEKRFDYDLNPLKLDDLKHSNHFNSTCMDTVPEAILCFLESTNYQDCIKLAISVGGDTDTMCCIAGGIAEAFYPRVTNGRGIPRFMLARTYNKLDQRMKKILSQFFAYINGNRPAQEDQYSEESFIEARKR